MEMLNFGMGELVVVLLIVLILFGASRVPEIARALGKSITEFKKAGKEARNNIEEMVNEENKKEES